jgi:hypothetical protein
MFGKPDSKEVRKMLFNNRKLIRNLEIGSFILMALMVLGSCSTAPTQVYSGPALPANQTALITSGFHTYLVSVDGVKVPGLSATVTPGTHTVVMRPADDLVTPYGYNQAYYFYSRVDGTVACVAQAGHTYRAEVNVGNPRHEQEPGEEISGTGFVWNGYIEDRTAETRVARTESMPLYAEPRGIPTNAPGGLFTR